MTTEIEYALMAGHAYRTTRDEINWFPVPEGWTSFFPVPDTTTAEAFPVTAGFEAISFIKDNEIVISFAGTGGDGDWWHGNIPLAGGQLSDQLRQAADYYLQVKASASADLTITFTGHSLGGGLASLLAVMFNEGAFTFDQAPFRNSALTYSEVDINTGATVLRSASRDLRAYLTGKGYDNLLAPLDAYIAATDPTNLNQNPADTLAAREANVVDIHVLGEILSVQPLFSRIGAQIEVTQQNSKMLFPQIELHSQALLTAFLQSDYASPQNQKLNEVTFKLSDLLQMVFDEKLYKKDPKSTEENFLERLVKHEAGVQGLNTADAMVTRFTSDLWKLAQDGGMTLKDGNSSGNYLSRGLTAFAMQMYYEDSDNAKDANKELFSKITGGLQFDMADVSEKFAQAFKDNQKLTLNDAKGFDLYLKYYFDNNLDVGDVNFTAEEDTLILSVLPYMRDWYIQAGASGMNATDTQNRGAFMLGGTGADNLTGGTSADLLVGNAGDDVLTGGLGNDFLIGGKGNDTYRYNTGEGFDTLLDSDGQGGIVIDGAILAGGEQYGDTHVHRDANKHLYVDVGNGRMVIDGNILIENYQANQLGLTMSSTPVAEPESTLTIIGDFEIIDFAPGTEGLQVEVDGLGNYLTNKSKPAAGQIDILGGSTGNDTLDGRGGNDFLYGFGGDDHIYGGSDSDLLDGGEGNDYLYADTQVDTATAIAQGNEQSGSGATGDWLNGDTGSDTLMGSNSNDFLAGGAGDDLLIGGAGNDVLLGDHYTPPPPGFTSQTWISYSQTGQTYAQPWYYDAADNQLVLLGNLVNQPPLPTTSGNDVLYAGAGNDIASGGYGNDVIFGEADDDILTGNSGNDVLIGGSGVDYLYGDLLENYATPATPGLDYLDGGAGNDFLYGNEGDDILIGGKDNDEMYGGAGRDTYIFNAGDGTDTLYDSIDNTKSNVNILRFGAGVNKDNIKLRLGSLMLDLGNGDAIHIEGFDKNDVFNSSSIGSFEFADGSSLSTVELLARGFDLDGTEGNDNIIGTDTTDRINGLAGNDMLVGMAGDDTLSGGIGDDTLTGGVGGDIYLFNRADGVDTIGDNGDLNSADTLQFGAGILQSDVTITRLGNGDLSFKLNGTTDEVVVQGYYTTARNGVERVVFGDGSILTGVDFENLPITGTEGDDVITGTNINDVILGVGGNDTLNGGQGNDTLDAGSGNDTLDGGLGNDTLQGGDGNDTYRYSIGMGMDTVMDVSADGNSIQLAQGIQFSELKAIQSGNDLLLKRSASHGMIIKNYFLTPQVWLVHDENGNTQTISDILASTANNNQDEYSMLRDEFFAEQEGQLQANYLEFSSVGNTVTKVNFVDDDLSGGYSIRSDYGMQSADYRDILSVYDSQTDIQKQIVNSDDAVIYATDGQVNSLSFKQVYASIIWDAPYNIRTSYMGASVIPVTDNYYGMPVGWFIVPPEMRVDSYTQDGVVMSLTGGDTLALQSTYMETFNLQEIMGGASDNTIYAWNNSYAVVNGGAGNDIIYGGGLSYGGEGSDVLYGSMYQYGGNGNDILTYGQVLSGGAGDDTMDGDGYDTGNTTRYLIDPTQAGIDLIHDTGDSTEAYKAWYYNAQGIQDWEMRDQRGGYYTSRSSSSDTGYFTYEELNDPGNWLSGAFANHPEDLLYIEPLAHVDWPAANDYAALQAAYDAGAISMDTVEFSEGIALSDLQLSWGETTRLSPVSWLEETYRTLILSWNGGASQVQLVIPHKDDPLGSGVEQIKFSDNTIVGMQTLIEMAPAGVTLDPVNAGLTLIGTEAADVLAGLGGNDTITGLGGDDLLNGGSGNDTLDGGVGNDVLNGGSGSDTYMFEAGNGVDTIVDNGGEGNILVFGAGVDQASVTLGLGSLLIKTGNGEDSIHIEDFDPNNVQSTPVIESFQFADGTSLTYSQLLERGFDIAGTAADDVLNGTNTTDRISGGAGNDILNGGAGNDTLSGGAGSDTYLFGVSSGQDTLVETAEALDTGSIDKIVFGAGITFADLTIARGGVDDNDLSIAITGSNDSLTIQGWFNPAPVSTVKQFVFSDGNTLEIETLFNHAPILSNTLLQQATPEDNVFSFIIPANSFTDIDNGDVLSYTATLADGTTLPAWLNFDASTQTFSGTADNEDVGNLNVLVTATDTGGLSASSAFTLDVINVNDAPTAHDDAGAASEDGGAVLLNAATLLANDTDPDFIHGDVLNIVGISQAASGAAVSLLNGNVQYDIGSLYQSLAQSQTATDTFSYTVSDIAGAMSTAIVTMTITGVNDATVTADDSTSVQEDGAISSSGNVLANDSDIDQGTVLNVANATTLNGNYGSLVLNADGAYSYLLDNTSLAVQSLGAGQVVTETFYYQASDGLVITPATLTVAITGTNDVPVAVMPLANQTATETGTFVYQLPTNAFADIDQSDTLTYTATMADGTALPVWLVFDASTLSFSSILALGTAGLWDINITATDNFGAGASSIFTLDVAKLIKGSCEENNMQGTALRDVMYGLNEEDILRGHGGDDVLVGGSGNDIVEGGAGNDLLIGGMSAESTLAGTQVTAECVDCEGGDGEHEEESDDDIEHVCDSAEHVDEEACAERSPGNNLLNGGAGNDTLIGGSKNDLLIGGIGNDVINTGSGRDIIAFNKGDGQDVVMASAGADNTLTLGGGIKTSDLSFRHLGNDLVLETGAAEQITFCDWYASSANHSIVNLQMIDTLATKASKARNTKFDFSALVSFFDKSVAVDSTTDHWALTNALLDEHLEQFKGNALGGDLAYQYGHNGTLETVAVSAAQEILESSSFGSKAQKLHDLPCIKDGIAMLG